MIGWPLLEEGQRRIGYARVSTADQKLDMQLDALNAVECEKIFSDHGVSGAKAKRPGLDALLRYVRPGDVVVVFKLDRMGRSVLHLADLLTRFRNEDIHFCSISEGINTTSSGGKMIYHIFSAIAEFHRDLIVENTMAGLDAARVRGQRLGRPPILDIDDALEALRMVSQEGRTLDEAAAIWRVSPTTVWRAVRRAEQEAA